VATGGMRKVKDGISNDLAGIISRGRSLGTYLDRVVWPQFQQAQINRWETQGASEGFSWPELNPTYAKRKKKKFAAFPGAGNAMMVATGRLSSGAQGRDTAYFGRTVTESKMTVMVSSSALPYAIYPGKARPFMVFSDDTMSAWTGAAAAYMMGGKK
jgi:hypothetical protein